MTRLVAWSLLFAACAGDAPAPAPVPAAPVQKTSALAAQAEAPAVASWVGVIASADTVDLAPRFDGVVASVTVRPGDVVEAGMVVASLDPRPLREEVAAAQAASRAARARGRQARIEVARARHRLEIEEGGLTAGTSARASVEDARLALRSAEAAVAEADAASSEAVTRVERASARLGETELRAPFAGSIGARYRDPGAAVGPNLPVVRVIGGGGLRLRFAVPPDEAAGLRPGVKMLASVGPGQDIDAVVEHIAPVIDPPSQLVFIDAALALGAVVTPGQAAVVRRGGAP